MLCVRKWVRKKRLLVCWSLHYSLENINIVHARMTLLPRYQLVVFVIIRQKLCLRPNRKVLLPFFRRTLRDSNYLCSPTLQLPSSIHCYDRTRHTIRYFESAFVIFNSLQALFLAFFPITCSKRSFFFATRANAKRAEKVSIVTNWTGAGTLTLGGIPLPGSSAAVPLVVQ